MATGSGKSPLAAKYGDRLKKAVEAHKDDPVRERFARVPPGIVNGIAQLTACGFGQVEAGKQNAGEYYFRAAGVVIEPAAVIVNGVEIPCAGAQTSILRMVCDQKDPSGKVTRSLDQNVADIQSDMKLLGAEDVSDLEATAAALAATAQPGQDHIYFRFSTSEKKAREYERFDPATKQRVKKVSDPGVWENWHGVKDLAGYQPGENGEVIDDTAAAEHVQEAEAAVNEGQGAGEEIDLDALLAIATDESNADESAGEKLKELALAAGMSEEEFGGASWEDVAAYIRSAAETAVTQEEEPAPEPEPWTPKVKSTCKYRPIDPKTKKPALNKAKKPLIVDCEVTAIDAKSKTCTLKNLDDGKSMYKGVKLTDLIAP